MEAKSDRTFQCCRKWSIFFCLVGIGLSYYSVYVSKAKTADPNYAALCDIGPTSSCSNVLTSEYSKGFGLIKSIVGEKSPFYQSNGVYGIVFYTLVMFLSLFPASIPAKLQLVMSISSLVVSAYLAYILFYILEDLCLVCLATYVDNFLLFIVALRNYNAVKRKCRRRSSTSTDYSSILDGKATKKRV